MQACNFPGARAIGKPADWIPELDGECGTIFVIDHFDEHLAQNIMYSVYKPTEADLAALNAGGAIRLGIHGTGHPVFQMGVLTAPKCEEAGLVPMWDLGDPI